MERYAYVVLGWISFLPSLSLAETPPANSSPVMRVMQTSENTRFGLFGEKPDAPRPTLFVFATSVDDMGKLHVYSEAGRLLAKHGWLYVTVDPPCHGHDHREGEPAHLAGWAHRTKSGENLTKPFVDRCVEVLDYLVKQGYTDPKQVAACGTSRGGFCALHFAANDSRINAVACVSPVTNLLALREFNGVTAEQVRSQNVFAIAEKLRKTAVWLSIGNDDQRVGTHHCVKAADRFQATRSQQRPGATVAPVELVIKPTNGHQPVKDAYSLAAQFVFDRVYSEAQTRQRSTK